MPAKQYVYKTMKSPVGTLTLMASDKGLAAILWQNDNPKRVRAARTTAHNNNNHRVLLATEKQLNDYFRKKRTKFDVALDIDDSVTNFQKKVWRVLLNIPFGKTMTYSEVAKKIGRPQSARAVGGAVGRNPIAIIAACHRVIGASGKLTGFAGGIKNKKYLLALEASAAHTKSNTRS